MAARVTLERKALEAATDRIEAINSISLTLEPGASEAEVIRQLDKHALRDLIARSANWVKITKTIRGPVEEEAEGVVKGGAGGVGLESLSQHPLPFRVPVLHAQEIGEVGVGRLAAEVLAAGNIDEFAPVAGADAMQCAKDLARKEGIFGGVTSGANVWAALQRARELGPGKTIVTVLCDSGTRYQSRLFNPAFLETKSLPVPPWLRPEGNQWTIRVRTCNTSSGST